MWHQGPAALRAESLEASYGIKSSCQSGDSRDVSHSVGWYVTSRHTVVSNALLRWVAHSWCVWQAVRYLRPVDATPRTAALTGRVTASAALLVAQGLLSANRGVRRVSVPLLPLTVPSALHAQATLCGTSLGSARSHSDCLERVLGRKGPVRRNTAIPSTDLQHTPSLNCAVPVAEGVPPCKADCIEIGPEWGLLGLRA